MFLRACRGEPVDRVPIWLMRQAGRYMPEYRAVRERADFLTVCTTPDLATEVTLQPVDRLGVDAAILFSDILVPVMPMGIRLTFDPGPHLDPVVRSAADVERLRDFDPEDELRPVMDAVRSIRRALEGRVPLIGFAAAPFTLAAYLVEGGGSSAFETVRRMLVAEPALAHRLIEKVTVTTERYLLAQAAAGAQALQMFDSWAGLLSVDAYREFALRPVQRVVEAARATGVPVVYFALGAGHMLEEVGAAGADVIGLDWRVGLGDASRRIRRRVAVQGNLDPCALLGPPDRFAAHVERILAGGRRAAGHVFNLGHGILPATPVEHAQALVEMVHAAPVPAPAPASSTELP